MAVGLAVGLAVDLAAGLAVGLGGGSSAAAASAAASESSAACGPARAPSAWTAGALVGGSKARQTERHGWRRRRRRRRRRWRRWLQEGGQVEGRRLGGGGGEGWPTLDDQPSVVGVPRAGAACDVFLCVSLLGWWAYRAVCALCAPLHVRAREGVPLGVGCAWPGAQIWSTSGARPEHAWSTILRICSQEWVSSRTSNACDSRSFARYYAGV